MFGVIMAGGLGTRFWPRSRARRPKQLLNIFGDKTMIQAAVERISPIVPAEKLFVVATEQQKEGILQQLPQLKIENLILEPKGKNTAPCIGLTALLLRRIDPNEVMVILPADHMIQQSARFLEVLIQAEKVAQSGSALVTIGIKPTYAATGYGYIQYNGVVEHHPSIPALRVKTFAEKPDLATAQQFLESGDFLWNSGMFLWKVSTIIQAIEKYMPELYDSLMEIDRALESEHAHEILHRVYCQIKSISIDYGIMEQAKNVIVLPGDFGWNDVGSWDEVHKLMTKDEHGNATLGNHVLKDVRDCLIDSPHKLVAAIGIEGLIVVDTPDALLICRKDQAQKVKDLVELMKRKNLDEFI
ncbi:NTP transferase domain-containing protein [candidate division KSB1 bacterium]|nr:NTP transferase domain-containing protein [candidate division KSB1 bacterium]